MTAAMTLLTDRQAAVLAELAKGLTADAAARRLAVSDRTVRRECERARDVLGVATTVEAIVVAAKRGVI